MTLDSRPGIATPGLFQPAAIGDGTTVSGTLAWSDAADVWAVSASGGAGTASVAWNDLADAWSIVGSGSGLVCTHIDIDMSGAVHEGAFAYVIFPFGPVGTTPDNTSFSTQSTLRLFENGIEIGPAHSLHADVDGIGFGRFSHYSAVDGAGESLRVSSSDNTNPITNGRTYAYCVPVAANTASIAWSDSADTWSLSGSGPRQVLIVKVAPFFATDTITAVGFQLYRYVGSTLTADGAHTTSGIDAIPSITNGYCVGLTADRMTLDDDGGYRAMIVWDSGGGSPFYVGDEVYIPATDVSTGGGDGTTWGEVIEGSYTAKDLLRILAAVAAGKTNALKLSNGAMVTFRNITDTGDMVEAQMQKSNRVTVTITP